MQAPTSLHPSDQTLRAFGNGQLDADSAEAVSAHLDECAECLLKVAGISSDGFLEALRNARSARDPEQRCTEMDCDRSRPASRPSLPCTEPTTSPVGDDLPAELAHHPDYKILHELGRGGMGVVYLAHNQLLGRDEVLKVMGSHIIARPGVMDRFLREMRAVAGLHHPNIVAAYTAFRCGESLVFAMEYVEGLDLARLVRARGPMPVANACSYVQQAALGLQHAHERGLVHRDIKPSNLMLSQDRDRALIKVLDFGLAKASREQKLDATLTSEGQMLGTPDFIAPEQITDSQRADIRADIYSLGCTLYYLLSGGPPFQGKTLYDLLQAHHSMDARLLNFVRPEVPTELAASVAKMMAKEPAHRFQTPAEVAQALTPFFKRGARFARPSTLLSVPTNEPATTSTLAEEVEVTKADPAASATPIRSLAPAPGANLSEDGWKGPTKVDGQGENRTAPATVTIRTRNRFRWYWPALAGVAVLAVVLIGAIMAYRITTDKGVLVIETDAPGIRVIVKRGGEQVAVIDAQAEDQAELNSGRYELKLSTEESGLRLSAEKVTLNRGEKIIISVRRERVPPPPDVKTPQQETIRRSEPGLLAGREATGETPRSPTSRETAVEGPRSQTEPVGPMERPATPRRGGLPPVGLLLEGQRYTNNAAFLPDGKRAVTVGALPDMVLWDVATGRKMRSFNDHTEGVWGIAVSPDGKVAVTGAQDHSGSKDWDLRVWDLRSERPLTRIAGGQELQAGLCFSPGGRRLFSACWDGKLYAWRVPTPMPTMPYRSSPLMPFSSPSKSLVSVAMSRDGSRLATGTVSGEIFIWDANSGELVRELVKPLNDNQRSSAIHSCQFLPDGHTLFSTFGEVPGQRGEIVIWDLQTYTPRIFSCHSEGVARGICSFDGLLVATGGARDRTVRLWDLATGQEVHQFAGFHGPVRTLAFSPDRRTLLAADQRGQIRLFPLPDDWQFETIPATVSRKGSTSGDVVVSPDGRRILSATVDGRLTLADLREGTIRAIGRPEGRILAVAFSPDGRYALSGGQDRIIRLRDLDTGRVIREVGRHRERIMSLAFSPDGRFAYSTSGGTLLDGRWQGGMDPAVRVWDVNKGQEVRKLVGHEGIVRSVAVSRDGRRVLSAGSDMAPILWDATTGGEILRLKGHTAAVSCVAFLPDGRRAVSCGDDTTVRLWDLASGDEIRSFKGHPNEVNWLTVSPDGGAIVSSCSKANELRIWDVESGGLIRRLNWWSVSPTRGSITPDGRIVWGGSDGNVRIYSLPYLDQGASQASLSKSTGAR
jgi:WD40 repeat protein/serine/threonine protein kinase